MQTGCVKKPCGWEMPASCCKGLCEPDDELLAELWDAAAEYAFHATCHRFPGCCPAETRPCPPCGCRTRCRCRDYSKIDLTDAFCYPICRDDDGNPRLDVVVNGEIIPADQWRLESDGVTLATPGRLGGGGCGSFPPQDYEAPNGAAGTWSIRATIGCPPPRLLLMGAAQFACELWKECHGQESCLPDGVRSIVRRGISMELGGLQSEQVDFETGGTGVAILDMAIAKYRCADNDAYAFFDPCHEDMPGDWTFVGVTPAAAVGSAP